MKMWYFFLEKSSAFEEGVMSNAARELLGVLIVCLMVGILVGLSTLKYHVLDPSPPVAVEIGGAREVVGVGTKRAVIRHHGVEIAMRRGKLQASHWVGGRQGVFELMRPATPFETELFRQFFPII
jgi:hypothetical protein